MDNKLKTCLASIREKTDFQPEVALILGSGLGDYADGIRVEATVEYSEIEGFPVSTVKGHKGRFVFGYVGDVPVVIMQGRVHYYEGYPMSDVVLPTRLRGNQRKLPAGRFHDADGSYCHGSAKSSDRAESGRTGTAFS